MGRKEMVEELRELRKTSGAKSISKMKLLDIGLEIEKLRQHTATTPSSSINGGTVKENKKMVSKIDDVKLAKEAEFPVAPEKVKVAKGVSSVGKKSETKPVVAKKVATSLKTVEKAPKKSAKKVKEVVSESDE